MADFDISAAAAAGAEKGAKAEVSKSGGDPRDVDYKAIAQSAAAAAAAGGCAAVGLAVAAPVCGFVASEAAAWVIDEAVPAIGSAISDIGDFLGFGKKRPPPVLISKAGSKEYWETNLASAQVSDVSHVFAAAIEKLQALHNKLGLPGPYATKDVVGRLRAVHGLPLDVMSGARPRGNFDYSGASGCEYVSTAGDWVTHPQQNRIQCKSNAAGSSWVMGYWAPDFRGKFEKHGGVALADARRIIATPSTAKSTRAPLAKVVASQVAEWDAKHVQPWEERLARAMAAEAADLEALVVANKVSEQITIEARKAAAPQVTRAPRTPPTLRGSTMFAVYTSQMTAAEVEAFRACVRSKVAAAGDGTTRREYLVQCRRQALGVRAASMADLTALQTGVSWRTLGLVVLASGAAAFWLKKRGR